MIVKQLMMNLDGRASLLEQSNVLPREATRVRVPPIKSQGIKTKLVPFILSSVKWDGSGRWVEPFVGSGSVVLNVAPSRALLADTNVHIIRFYHDIARGYVTPESVRDFLQRQGRLLASRGDDYYYEVRDRFNANPSSHDFLFLNRACFNGVIRFNSKGEYNVPFGKKPERFNRAYVTKIVNQVAYVSRLIKNRDWTFKVSDWRETIEDVAERDFVYTDPPYFGRHTDYYNNWTEQEATQLLDKLRNLPCGFAMSTWKENKYRKNPYLPSDLPDVTVRTFKHFYHVGPTESLRNEMEEALVIKNCSVACA